jgi:regulatory protein YycI of two-component signal transduction system YycFG
VNWSRTKSIFIVTFFILNVFLGYQLYAKQKNADDIASLPGEETTEESFENDDISWPQDLPDVSEVAYIRGDKKVFQEEELEELENGSNGDKIQKINPGIDQTTLTAKLADPVDLPEEMDSPAVLGDFLETYIYNGNEYQFWRRDKQSLTFIQTFKDRSIFSKSGSGSLQVQVEDGKISGYEQTYIKFDNYKEKKKIISPMVALDNLHDNHYLSIGSKITVVELSYFNLIAEPLDEGKIFVPIWHVIVTDGEEEDEYFVNAITKAIQTLEEDTE